MWRVKIVATEEAKICHHGSKDAADENELSHQNNPKAFLGVTAAHGFAFKRLKDAELLC